ncbi:MAG: nucleoside-diphosphate kinase [Bacteroidales bacterium]|nr:nucleoside-diphosphate kinase [Bacteroidales bacterium]
MSKAGNITFTIIKPGAVANEHIGDILQIITKGGFWITAMKYIKLSQQQAMEFYSVHAERPFYNDLVKFMTSGPIVVAVLEKDNAVEDYRKLIGATNPVDAAEGTIRKLFAESIERNAVHGSDSDQNAQIEADFFFSRSDKFNRKGEFPSPASCE